MITKQVQTEGISSPELFQFSCVHLWHSIKPEGYKWYIEIPAEKMVSIICWRDDLIKPKIEFHIHWNNEESISIDSSCNCIMENMMANVESAMSSLLFQMCNLLQTGEIITLASLLLKRYPYAFNTITCVSNKSGALYNFRLTPYYNFIKDGYSYVKTQPLGPNYRMVDNEGIEIQTSDGFKVNLGKDKYDLSFTLSPNSISYSADNFDIPTKEEKQLKEAIEKSEREGLRFESLNYHNKLSNLYLKDGIFNLSVSQLSSWILPYYQESRFLFDNRVLITSNNEQQSFIILTRGGYVIDELLIKSDLKVFENKLGGKKEPSLQNEASEQIEQAEQLLEQSRRLGRDTSLQAQYNKLFKEDFESARDISPVIEKELSPYGGLILSYRCNDNAKEDGYFLLTKTTLISFSVENDAIVTGKNYIIQNAVPFDSFANEVKNGKWGEDGEQFMNVANQLSPKPLFNGKYFTPMVIDNAAWDSTNKDSLALISIDNTNVQLTHESNSNKEGTGYSRFIKWLIIGLWVIVLLIFLFGVVLA